MHSSRRPRLSKWTVMRISLALALCLAAAALTAGCGSPSDSTVEKQVATNISTSSGHPVSVVSCSKGIAHPPQGAPPATAADRTCDVAFSDGTKPQVWAVKVTNLGVTDSVVPMYRLDDPAAGLTQADLRTSAAAVFAAASGKRVLSVKCSAGSDLKGGADHRCRAVFADRSHSVWAVEVGATGARLIYPIG